MIQFPNELTVRTPFTFVNFYGLTDPLFTISELILFKDNIYINFKFLLIEDDYIIYGNNVVLGIATTVKEIINQILNYSETYVNKLPIDMDSLIELFIKNKYIAGGYYLIFNKDSKKYFGKTLLI